MRVARLVAIVALVLLAGCSNPRQEAATPALEPVTPGGWVRTGSVAMAAEGETSALRISGIASVHSDSITTIVVSFEDALGAPAMHPANSHVVLRPEVRVLRLQLPRTVTSWAFTDHAFESGLVSRATVERGPDSSVVLELHLAEPASARALFGDVTAPLTIDLRRGG